jgi:hypothetical protein
MYRTLYFRYLSQKKYEELLELLYKGATTLLKHDQSASGADLSLLIVDVLEKANLPDYEIWIQRIGVLLNKIGPNVIERETLMIKAISWSSDASKAKLGHPLLHKLIAEIFWSEGNLEQARHHYLLSKDGAGCGQMLIELSQTKGYSNETDLFIAQVVLQQLCIKERTASLETFETYTKYHPKIACLEPPFKFPLINFLYILLHSLDTRKLSLFKALCELYKPSLDRDSSYDKYLQKIGIIYFDAPAPQPQRTGGFLGSLINQLFQGLEGDENELDEIPRTHNGSGTRSNEGTELD